MGKPACTFLLLTAAFSLLLGCSGNKGPQTAPVMGKVTLNGQPLEGANVTFIADGAPRAAIGTTDAQGVYRLTTFKSNDGAVLGQHKVTVVMPVKNTAEMSAETPDAAYGAAMAQAAKGVQQRGKEVPAKYANPATSGFSTEVKSGTNEYNIELQP